MRIVHVITKGDVGGAQTHVVELAGAQAEAGDDVVVVAGTDGPAMDRCRASGIEVVIVPSLGVSRSQLWQRAALADLREALHELQPDVVHAHSSNAGFLARVVARRAGWPSVYTAHGWPFQRGASWSQRVLSFVGELIAGRIGDAVICLTPAEARRARRAHVVPADRLWVVPNGLADVGPALRRHDGDRDPALVMVARFAPPKMQDELVDVMVRLLDLPWTLTFVGDGPGWDASQRRGSALLGERVRYLGHRDDVASLLAEHDAVVLWSRYEGMPISLLEGMRAGLCVVAGDLPGVRALVGDPPDGGVVAGDAEELTEVLRNVLAEPARLRALGDRARSRYEAHFSATAMRASTTRVYEQLRQRP